MLKHAHSILAAALVLVLSSASFAQQPFTEGSAEFGTPSTFIEIQHNPDKITIIRPDGSMIVIQGDKVTITDSEGEPTTHEEATTGSGGSITSALLDFLERFEVEEGDPHGTITGYNLSNQCKELIDGYLESLDPDNPPDDGYGPEFIATRNGTYKEGDEKQPWSFGWFVTVDGAGDTWIRPVRSAAKLFLLGRTWRIVRDGSWLIA